MTGSVDNVNLIVSPEACRRGRSYGDTSLLFLFHEIHRCRAIVDFAHAVRFACIEKYPFGRSCLTGIYVCHDTNVTRSF
jgi:hypothetical protein